METKIIGLLSRFGCTEMPTSKNLLRLITGVAKYHFMGKIFGTLFTMRAGVPLLYHTFWETFSVEELFTLYKALNATTASVLTMLKEPEYMNVAQERLFSYLTTYIGNMKSDELRLFLRFVTGSSVVVAQHISIFFNLLSGVARRPISHTCDCSLQLSIDYSTFPEFEQEFSKVLSSEYSWYMDGI